MNEGRGFEPEDAKTFRAESIQPFPAEIHTPVTEAQKQEYLTAVENGDLTAANTLLKAMVIQNRKSGNKIGEYSWGKKVGYPDNSDVVSSTLPGEMYSARGTIRETDASLTKTRMVDRSRQLLGEGHFQEAYDLLHRYTDSEPRVKPFRGEVFAPEQQYKQSATVNGIQFSVAFDRQDAFHLDPDENGVYPMQEGYSFYQIYFPQIEDGGRQVENIGTDPRQAAKVFEFAKKQAESSQNVDELHDAVVEFISRLREESRQS